MQRKRSGTHRTYPPGAQAEQNKGAVTERRTYSGDSAGNCERRSFEQKQEANLRRWKAEGTQDTDFVHPLLDPEFEKQACQQQRRDHQEEAEVHEVFAEIGRAASGLKALSPHRENYQSEPRGFDGFA